MRKVEITKTYELYKFAELSDAAKNKAITDYMNFAGDMLSSRAYEDLIGFLYEYFPASMGGVEVQFDLSCRQGSGLNIYGEISGSDIIYYMERYAAGDVEIPEVFRECADNMPPVELSYNNHYCYSRTTQDYNDFIYETINIDGTDLSPADIIEYAESHLTWSGRYELLDAFPGLWEEYKKLYRKFYYEIELLERDFYNLAYNICNPNEEDFAELSEKYGWEYTANGKLFEDF